MVRPFRPDNVNGIGSAGLSWLNRFQISLEAECAELFGDSWGASIDADKSRVCIESADRKHKVCVPLHPGSHVVAPVWAAHQYADQLYLAAITRGLVAPPPGRAAADEP